MKKVVLCFLCMLLLFSGCSVGFIPPEPTPYDLEPGPDYVLVDDITFRRGEEADGEILFTGDVLEKVSGGHDDMLYPKLTFTFTEEGKKLLFQVSSELYASGEKMSCWIGKEQIFAAPFTDPISEGAMTLTLRAYTQEQADAYFYQFYGKD